VQFLVDRCVSRAVCDDLPAAGHDVQWVRDLLAGDPGDEAIIDAALSDERVFLRGKAQPPLVRLAAMNPTNQVRVVRKVLESHAADLERSALIKPLRRGSAFVLSLTSMRYGERSMTEVQKDAITRATQVAAPSGAKVVSTWRTRLRWSATGMISWS